MATITRKELIISDEFWIEIIDALLNNILLFDMNKKDFIKEVLKYKNEILILLPDEQTEKYKELIEVMDKLYEVSCDALYEHKIDPTGEMGKLYIKIQKLKTELGL
jgi:hypothetical protein